MLLHGKLRNHMKHIYTLFMLCLITSIGIEELSGAARQPRSSLKKRSAYSRRNVRIDNRPRKSVRHAVDIWIDYPCISEPYRPREKHPTGEDSYKLFFEVTMLNSLTKKKKRPLSGTEAYCQLCRISKKLYFKKTHVDLDKPSLWGAIDELTGNVLRIPQEKVLRLVGETYYDDISIFDDINLFSKEVFKRLDEHPEKELIIIFNEQKYEITQKKLKGHETASLFIEPIAGPEQILPEQSEVSLFYWLLTEWAPKEGRKDLSTLFYKPSRCCIS